MIIMNGKYLSGYMEMDIYKKCTKGRREIKISCKCTSYDNQKQIGIAKKL